MMKRLALLSAAAAFSLTACAPGATETAAETPAVVAEELLLALPEGTAPEITADDLAVRIKTLADDTFEGRGPGTLAGEASAAWVAAEMARVGLTPGGD
ncbi:MAG: peptidase M28, partial [Hyphomonas sp.]